MHFHDGDSHILTILICSYSFTLCIRISSIIIPSFPRPVLNILGNLYHSTFKVSVIILRFHVKSFKWILITSSVCNIRGKVSSWTLTTNPAPVSISDIWALKDLDSLVGNRARTICNWICGCTHTPNIRCNRSRGTYNHTQGRQA